MLIGLIATVLLALASPQPDAARQLAARALGPTPLLEDLQELCDRVGGRPTGSAACERAVSWAEARFRAAGLKVAAESFPVPSLWLPGAEEAACLSPEAFPLRVAGAPYASPTPRGAPIEARLVVAGHGAEEDFDRLGPEARGAIALVLTGEMASLSDLFDEYMRNAPMLRGALRAGVAALLVTSTRPRGLLYRHPVGLDGRSVPIPVAMISREQGARLSRLAGAGEVRVRLRLDSRLDGAYEARNVVAEIRGGAAPEEIVLVGAHLDSWDLGTGALDNGVNAALLIDMARGMKELGMVPRRTVRFALFTGEEQGMWGSAGYVHRHAAELDRHVAAVILDIGSGRIKGFYLNGRDELRRPVAEALEPVAGFGPFLHPSEALDGTDNFDFLLSGVPNLVADQDPAPYLPDYHAESDVYERVDAREAKINEAVATALVWALADRPGTIARRQTRAQVEELLARTGLVSQMQAFGQWDDWISRKRGESR